MKVAFSSSFQRAFKKLVRGRKSVEEAFWTRVELFTEDPFDPRLKTHKLSGQLKELKSIKGLFYLAALLRYPDRAFSHLDLTLEAGEGAADTVENISREDGLSVSTSPEAAHEVLDRRAIRDYKSTLNDLKVEWENAKQNGDLGTAERLKKDIDQIEEELFEELGFGGKSHRRAEAAKNLRDRVNQAIRGARGKIEEHHPKLGQHLATSLHRQGEWCYRPGCAIAWVT